MKRIAIATSLLCSASNAVNPRSAPSVHRQLAVDALVNDANREKANEISDGILKTMRDLRGGTDEFYQDLLESLTVTMCDQATKAIKSNDPEDTTINPGLRFVNIFDDNAYKRDDGTCIKVGVPEDEVAKYYAQGLCEVKPNCFWGPILPGDAVRATMYSKKDTRSSPPEGALDVGDANKVLETWATGLVIFVAPGIVLSGLSLLSMVLFILCRCCCNKCGGRNARPEGYSCCQKLLPLIFFVLFSAGIAATAGVSLLFNQQVTDSVTEVFSISSSTLDSALEWTGKVKSPLINIRDTVLNTVDSIKTELSNTDFVETGLDNLIFQLEDFGDHTAGVTLPSGCDPNTEVDCVPCTVCTSISTNVQTSTTEMRSAAGSGVKQLADTRKTLNGELVDISATIKDMVDARVLSIVDLETSIVDAKGSVDKIKTEWDAQDSGRDTGVLAMFALAIVVVIVGLVGVLFGLTPLRCLSKIIHIAYLIGFLALFIGFLIAAVLIAISVLLGDVCEVTKIVRDDWTPLMGPEGAKGMNACFNNVSLLEAYNLTGALDFQDQIVFPSGLNLDSMLDFSNFDTFASSIDNTNSNTFAVDQSVMNTMISLLNGYVSQNNVGACAPNDMYALNNILTPWDANSDTFSGDPEVYMRARYSRVGANAAKVALCDTSPAAPAICTLGQTPCTMEEAVIELYNRARTLRQIEVDAAVFVTEMKTNMTNILTYVSNFKSDITNLDVSITGIQDDLELNLYKYTDDFMSSMYCTFIGIHFDELFATLCGDMMPAVLVISLMIFLMAIFLIPVNVCLIILVKRLQSTRGYKGAVFPDEETEFK